MQEIRYEGQIHRFPDDFSEADIAAALQGDSPGSSSTQPSPAPQDQGILASLKEAFTGEQRQTPETQALPDWSEIPELQVVFNGTDRAKALTARAAINFSGPEEMAQQLKSFFPQMGVRQDAKGNYIFKSAIDNQEYAVPPGLAFSDVTRAMAGAPLMAIPFGRTIPAAIGLAAGTQAGIELSQAAGGGTFDPEAVALAGGLGGGLRGAANGVAAAARGVKSLLPGAEKATQTLTRTPDQALVSDLGATAAADAPNTITVGAKSPIELADLAKRAAKKGSPEDIKALAEQGAPDPTLAAAASAVDANLSPGMMTGNQAVKDLYKAAESAPGSVTAGNKAKDTLEISDKLKATLDEAGATGDYSKVNIAAKKKVLDNVEAVKERASQAYNQLGKDIPPQAPAPAPKAITLLESKAKDLGGKQHLSKVERMALAKLSPTKIKPTKSTLVMADGTPMSPTGQPPTYALFDKVLKDVGAATKNPALSAEERARASALFTVMREEDLPSIVTPYGRLEQLNQAKALAKEGFDRDAAARDLFGKQLSQNLSTVMKKGVQELSVGGDPAAFAKRVAEIPEQYRAEAVMNGLRRTLIALKNDGSIDLGKFHRTWGALQEQKSSFNAIAAHAEPGVIKKLEALALLSKTISTPAKGESVDLIKQRIMGATSLTEKLSEVVNRSALRIGAQKVANFFGLNIFAASAATRDIVGSPASLATRNLRQLDVLLSSPELRMTMKKIGTPEEQIAVKKFIMSKPFKALKKALGNPTELSDSERFVMQALKAGIVQDKDSKL